MRNFIIFLCLVFSQVSLAQLPYNTNGWVDDPQARREYQRSPEHQLLRTKFIKVASLYKHEEGSALLYRALYQLKKELGELSDLEKQTGRLDAENQGQLGSCVGFGSGSAIDQRGAVMAYSRSVWSKNNRWVGLVAKGHIYALSRIGHGGFGDGSTGSWMASSISKYGIPFRSQKAGQYDFNDYNIGLIRSWTRSGSVPQEVTEKASEYKGRAVLVEDTEEARVALQRGFPIYICSQSSFRTTRDSQGVSPRTGRAWAHCMNVCAYIDELDAFVILNSWGPDKQYGGWIGGPVGFLEDLPQGAFICSRRDMEYILKQGDSYCIAELDTLVNLINWKNVITEFKGLKK